VVSRQNADIADNLHLRDIAMATTFGFRWATVVNTEGAMLPPPLEAYRLYGL